MGHTTFTAAQLLHEAENMSGLQKFRTKVAALHKINCSNGAKLKLRRLLGRCVHLYNDPDAPYKSVHKDDQEAVINRLSKHLHRPSGRCWSLKLVLLVAERDVQLMILNISLLCHVLFITEMLGKPGRGMKDFNEDPNMNYFHDAGTGGTQQVRFFELCRINGSEMNMGWIIEYIHEGGTGIDVLLEALQSEATSRAAGAALDSVVGFFNTPGNGLFSTKPSVGSRRKWPAERKKLPHILFGLEEVDRWWLQLALTKTNIDTRDQQQQAAWT